MKEVINGVEHSFRIHRLESCDICMIDWSLFNINARLDHQKELGKAERKSNKLQVKSIGCAHVDCPNRANENITTFSCSGCRQVVYCSKTCQKGAWPTHKIPCKAKLTHGPGTRLELIETPADSARGIICKVLRFDEV